MDTENLHSYLTMKPNPTPYPALVFMLILLHYAYTLAVISSKTAPLMILSLCMFTAALGVLVWFSWRDLQ